jgi:uncharacterized cofD-like protein
VSGPHRSGLSVTRPRPAIAALGGGTGLAAALRGLKHFPCDLTAIVTVADDGGSSGRLRRELGILPPGDIRNCLVALADDESMLSQLFQHRFSDGDLSGHSFGNLFLAALTEVTGNFDLAIAECSRVLRILGRVLPTTLEEISINAVKLDGRVVRGESVISGTPGACRRVWLDPPKVAAHLPAVGAIASADLVLLGPGSLFTSVMPHLSIPEIAQAVTFTGALRVYVCNVMTQPGETDGMSAAEHLERVLEAVPGSVDAVLVHDGPLDPETTAAYAKNGQEPIRLDGLEELGVRVVRADLAMAGNVVRHDSTRLAAAILELAREASARWP